MGHIPQGPAPCPPLWSEHPLWKALVPLPVDTHRCTHSTESSAPQERSGWRCSGPEVLLSQPWALHSGVSQGVAMRGPPPAPHVAPVTGDDWQLLPASFHGAQGIPSTSAPSFSLRLPVPHTFLWELASQALLS